MVIRACLENFLGPLEKERLRKGREEEKESPLSEGIFADTP